MIVSKDGIWIDKEIIPAIDIGSVNVRTQTYEMRRGIISIDILEISLRSGGVREILSDIDEWPISVHEMKERLERESLASSERVQEAHM